MIDKTVLEFIQATLSSLEASEGIKVLYAVESGSRAWGFPSRDSDYDVRFIYIHRPEWYLSIEERRDVIERNLEHDVDLSGWDIRKALLLFRKSNPPLLEWLHSPIVYREHPPFTQALRSLLPSYYSPRACMHHYLNMASGNLRHYLQGESVWTKKYLYVLRPVLAAKWLEQDLGVVPVEFDHLVEELVDDPELRRAIEELLARKRQGAELDKGSRIEIISRFVESEVERLEAKRSRTAGRDLPFEPLNRLFRGMLEGVDANL